MISFYLNDELLQLSDVKPTDLLIDLLRSRQIDQTGTKLGCGEGGCGACTVFLSEKDFSTGEIVERPINSCLRPVCSLDGKVVTTVEGINKKQTNPISKRLAEFNGSQCGYCSSGMVMSMYGLLKNSDKPTSYEVENQFSGNICRCTGYRSILNAMQSFVGDENAVNKATDYQISESQYKVAKPLDIEDRNIKWINATSVKQVLGLLEKYGTNDGKTVKLVNGNTSIGIYKWPEYKPSILINISTLTELNEIKLEGANLSVGGGATLAAIMKKIKSLEGNLDPELMKGLSALYKHMERIANHQVRNIASIAGNIMLVKNHEKPGSGEPFPSDMFTVLFTLGAQVEIISPGNGKPKMYYLPEMPEISSWPKGFLITKVVIPLSNKIDHIRTFKISRRNQNAHAIVNAGFYFSLDTENTIIAACIVYGGIGRIAYADIDTEGALVGEKWDRNILTIGLTSVLNSASKIIVPMPSTGISEAYRLELTQALFHQCFVSISLEVAPDIISPAEASAGKLFERPISEGEYNYLEAPFSEDGAGVGTRSFAKQLTRTSRDMKSISPLENVSYKTKSIDESHEAASDIDEYPTKITALSQTTGRAKYTHDLQGPSATLSAYYILSEFRNGDFAFDCTKEELLQIVQKEYPTVVALITAEDMPNKSSADTYDPKDPAQYDPVFAEEKVTSYGQPIGLVLAEEELDAKQGAWLVQTHIQYKEDPSMPTAVTIKESLAIPNDLGVIKGGVEWVERPIPSDDPEANEKKQWLKDPSPVDGQVYLEGQQDTGAQYHFYMEPQGTLAVPMENNQLEVYTSSQHLSSCQDRIASALGLPANKVKAKVVRLGGGFGGKEVRPPVVAAAAGIAAHAVNKPVRLMLDRNTDMQTIGDRHPYKGKYYLSADENGKIDRLKFDFYANAGFSKDCSVPVMDLVLLSAEGAYMVPVFRADGTVCRTNIQTRTAFRSFGLIQCSLIRENAIEQLAHKLGKRAEEIRELNFYKDATLDTWEFTPFGQALKFCRINQIWEDFKEKIDFDERVEAVEEFNKKNKWKKRGISMIPIKYGISYTYRPMNQGYAYVFAYSDDGTVLVHHGGIEMGQGLNTKMAQIASEILGIDFDLISIGNSATNVIPNASSTGASTGADLNGGAVKNACLELRARLEKFCEEFIAKPSKFPDLRPGAVPADWKEKWSEQWPKIISSAYTARIDLAQSAFFGSPKLGTLDDNKQVSKDKDGNPEQMFYYYNYCVAASEVEVNILTGENEILRADIVYDAGKSLNPKIDVGQIEGGFMQGVGNVTTEEIYYAENGRLIPNGTWNYKPPETANIPIDFNIYLLKYVKKDEKTFAPMDHYGIQSSKSTGEPPLVLANTVFFAIKQAIMDHRKEQGSDEWFDLASPATVERIQQACKVEISS